MRSSPQNPDKENTARQHSHKPPPTTTHTREPRKGGELHRPGTVVDGHGPPKSFISSTVSPVARLGSTRYVVSCLATFGKAPAPRMPSPVRPTGTWATPTRVERAHHVGRASTPAWSRTRHPSRSHLSKCSAAPWRARVFVWRTPRSPWNCKKRPRWNCNGVESTYLGATVQPVVVDATAPKSEYTVKAVSTGPLDMNTRQCPSLGQPATLGQEVRSVLLLQNTYFSHFEEKSWTPHFSGTLRIVC